MKNVLYVNASPRGELSASNQAANIFLEALDTSIGVGQIDLFERLLPDVTPEVTSAKFKTAMGVELTDEESRQWAEIVALVDEFKVADHYVFGIPMWNFNVPYKFKQYIDLLTHPGLTNSRDESGAPIGLIGGSATLIYSRGGDYAPKDGKPDPFDFQSPYVRAWLETIGIDPANEVLVQNTMMGPEVIEGVREHLERIAKAL